jgi:hypothetical protein
VSALEPPIQLAPDTFASRLYTAMAPLAKDDSANGWSLLIFCNAVGTMFQLVEDIVRDTPDGPGWSVLLDLDRCPTVALDWLGQFVGVRIPKGFSDADARARIAGTDGFRRGTRQAIFEAMKPTLTGAQNVFIWERAGEGEHGRAGGSDIDGAYYLVVHTYDTETPDPALTQRALIGAKPGALVLNYMSAPGQSWRQLRDSGRTWRDVLTQYATWDTVRLDQPPAPPETTTS